MLIAFGGLPGTGKTTLARALAKRYAAVYLRIDTIEQAIRCSGELKADMGSAGYMVAYQLAEDNLRMGRDVVADSVNALQITRDAWALAARNASVPLIEVEAICSDLAEHRGRIEGRQSDINGLRLSDWKAVSERVFEAWSTPHIVIDTARKPISDAERELMDHLTSAGYLAM
ncbi:MAG TPA: AAA family ATPase [Edaphobacter sp.]|nr:AAA family ATPase [Edaphobacter sp.]